MALNSIDAIYDKITIDDHLDINRLSEYLATLVEKSEDYQERICCLESKVSRLEDDINELNRDNYDFQARY